MKAVRPLSTKISLRVKVSMFLLASWWVLDDFFKDRIKIEKMEVLSSWKALTQIGKDKLQKIENKHLHLSDWI